MDANRKRKGFSLIELLVVLAVLSILSASLILYNHNTRQLIELYTEQAKLVQVITRAKSLSLSTYREAASVKLCGYGIHVDYSRGTYTLFRYLNPLNAVCRNISLIDPDLQETVTVYAINREIIPLLTPPASASRIDDLLFVPPDPKTIINSGGLLLSAGSGVIALQTQSGEATSIITVNSSGQVTF